MDAESIRSELRFRVSRSSGPGGQHAQKSSTRVEALFDVESSSALTESERRRVLSRLGPTVRAVAQDERSQLVNRELAADRVIALVAEAARPRRPRRPTEPTESSRRRRLDEKRRQSELKRLRRPPAGPD
jgi:ribosome-associated protein